MARHYVQRTASVFQAAASADVDISGITGFAIVIDSVQCHVNGGVGTDWLFTFFSPIGTTITAEGATPGSGRQGIQRSYNGGMRGGRSQGVRVRFERGGSNETYICVNYHFEPDTT